MCYFFVIIYENNLKIRKNLEIIVWKVKRLRKYDFHNQPWPHKSIWRVWSTHVLWATCCENLQNVFLNYIWLCLCLFALTWFAQNFATQNIHDNILGTSLGFSGLSCAKGIIYLLHFNYKPRKIYWKIRAMNSCEKIWNWT